MTSHEPEVPPGVPASPKRFRIGRGVLVFLAGLIAIAVGLRAVLPLLIERGVAYGSRQYLGLPARVDNVDLSLLKGTIVLEGVSVGAVADPVSPRAAAIAPPPVERSAALLHIDRVSARLSWRDLLKRTIRLAEVSVESPSLRVLQDEDRVVDPLRHAKPAAVTSESRAGGPGEPWAVEIGRFALRTPSIVLEDPANSRNPLELSLESLELDDAGAAGGNFTLGAVRITGPVLRVRKDLEIARGGAPAARPASDANSPPPTRPPGYRLNKIDIERAKFTWVADEGPLDVMMTLKASGITADEGARFPIELALKIANADIRLVGDLGFFPLAYSGTLAWDGLSCPPLLLSSAPELAAWVRSADSSGNLKIDADIAGAQGPPALKLSGRTAVESFVFADPGDKDFSLAWKRLEVGIGSAVVPISGGGKSSGMTKVDFDFIRLVEPEIRYTHPAPALNALLGISATEGGSSGSAKPAASAAGKAQEVSIAELEVTGGDIKIRDTTVHPAALTTIGGLSVTASGVRYPDPSAEAITLRATLPTNSMLVIEGGLKPGNVGDFTILLEHLDLPAFNSYAKAAGASLDAGRASLKTKLQTRGAAITSDNELVLQKFGVSLRDPSSFSREFGMPIDLALALMSDAAGDIRLTIPIRMDEKGASVGARTVIASALKAALVGAVSTPLKLLGATTGIKPGPAGDGLLIAPIGGQPGRTEPDSDAPARVARLMKLLAQRPTMGLVLRGRTGPADQPLVAEQVLRERLKAGQKLPEPAGVGLLARQRIGHILSSRAKNDPALSDKDRALLDRYLAAVGNITDQLDALAKSRAENVRTMLVAKGVSAKHVTVGDREADGPPGVVVSLSKKQPAPPRATPKL